ncbi:MAG: hypothetical protein N3A66_08550, partial [Planctomycetota bacterium]|nr:hypothetical protein [Planctomycetota bacterium]
GLTATHTIGVMIPRQPQFPPAGGVEVGAQITVNGIDYQVDNVRWDNEDMSMAACCICRCGRYGYTVEME